MSIEIELSKKGNINNGKYVAIVDDKDADLKESHWTVFVHPTSRTKYAFRNIYRKRTTEMMHNVIAERFLGKKPIGMQTDHINRNGLDNRRSNLRYANRSIQSLNVDIRSDNTSGSKGVDFYRPGKKWRARIIIQGRTKYLGYYINKEDAIKARKIAEGKFLK